jgi:hypothetical protein
VYESAGPYGQLPGRYYQGPYAAPPMERTDEEIHSDVVTRLQLDPWVNDQAVRVDVNLGVVTLTGEVDVMNEKRAAGDDAWDTPGVSDVSNELLVRKPQRLARARLAPRRRRMGPGGQPGAGVSP